MKKWLKKLKRRRKEEKEKFGRLCFYGPKAGYLKLESMNWFKRQWYYWYTR